MFISPQRLGKLNSDFNEFGVTAERRGGRREVERRSLASEKVG